MEKGGEGEPYCTGANSINKKKKKKKKNYQRIPVLLQVHERKETECHQAKGPAEAAGETFKPWSFSLYRASPRCYDLLEYPFHSQAPSIHTDLVSPLPNGRNNVKTGADPRGVLEKFLGQPVMNLTFREVLGLSPAIHNPPAALMASVMPSLRADEKTSNDGSTNELRQHWF